ncbi:MAG: HAD family phosphatase [Muribaculum sp.]|nr:HAD family phosphatase [Muribaculum sp.]
MIRNIVFDIGNVLTDFCWKEFLRGKGFDDEMIRRIGRASVESPVWREFDRGTWSEEELMRAFVANDPEIERELHEAYDDVRGMVTARAYAIPWVRELKARGYRVFYLSNFAKKAEEECADALAFLPDMDGGILSWRDGLIKPDPEIYRLLLKRYGLKAQECVFVDDLPENVAGAVAQGFHGIVFESREQTEEALRKLAPERA